MVESRMHLETKEEVARMIRRGPGYLIVSHEVDCRWESFRVAEVKPAAFAPNAGAQAKG